RPMARSLDHLIRPRQQRRRDRQPERPGRLEVDHQLESGRLLDRQVAGPAPRKILSTYTAARRNWEAKFGAVGHETAGLDFLPETMHRRQPVPHRETDHRPGWVYEEKYRLAHARLQAAGIQVQLVSWCSR